MVDPRDAFQSQLGDAMIIYEKMWLIQGKTVETLLFFFQLRIHETQCATVYPTRGGLEAHPISVTLAVLFDIRVVRFGTYAVDNVRVPCEGISMF